MQDVYKECNDCGEIYPHSPEFFDLAIRSAVCRACRNEEGRDRRRTTRGSGPVLIKARLVQDLAEEITLAITATSAHYVSS